MNRVILGGRIGTPIQLRTTARGVPYVNVSIAVQDRHQDRPEWFDCIAWGRVAKALIKGTNIGDTVEIEGTLSLGHFTDEDGEPISVMRTTINDFSRIALGKVSRELEREERERASIA